VRKGPSGSGALRIEYRNVTFAYPSRPDVQVLVKFNLVIEPGQCVGVVGASGSGKSTLALLAMRAYDPQSGAVLVDGVDVKEWNVAALRSQFGLVQQEPALFADSVAYNIAYGCALPEKMESGLGAQPKESGDNTDEPGLAGGKQEIDAKPDAAKGHEDSGNGNGAAAEIELEEASAQKDVVVQVSGNYPPPPDDVVAAAEKANAAGFVKKLPDDYATFCGSRGSQLSGGQKQRVAIARALLRAPPLLLLDEATAALDSHSESVVQAALDQVIEDARRGGAGAPPVRTTLVIAHRLSTLAKADRIVVLDQGRVVEDGSHSTLMARPDGKYRALAVAQQTGGSI
jgi:ABC-type multidrug transport system fused ATPase/permease subunit